MNTKHISKDDYLKLCSKLHDLNYLSKSSDKLLIAQFDCKYHTLDYNFEVYIEEFNTIEELNMFYGLEDDRQMDIFDIIN